MTDTSWVEYLAKEQLKQYPLFTESYACRAEPQSSVASESLLYLISLNSEVDCIHGGKPMIS